MIINGLSDGGPQLERTVADEFHRRKRHEIERGSRERLSRNAKNSLVYMMVPVVEGVTPAVLLDDGVSRDFTSKLDGSRFREGVFRTNEVGLSAFEHSVLYGDGFFAGIRMITGKDGQLRIPHLREHMMRFWDNAATLDTYLHLHPADLAFRLMQSAQVRENLVDSKEPPNYFRLVGSRGAGDLGINPNRCVGNTLFALVTTIGLYQPSAYTEGMELGLIKNHRKALGDNIPPQVKATGAYVAYMLGLQEVMPEGFHEGVLLTDEGYVTEATVANLFIVKRRNGWERDRSSVELHTANDSLCLNGITRAHAIAVAQRLGYTVLKRNDILPAEFYGSNAEVFMTGTGAQLVPVRSVDGKQVGDGVAGPVTEELLQIMRADLRENSEFSIPIAATERQLLEYMSSPSPISYLPPSATMPTLRRQVKEK